MLDGCVRQCWNVLSNKKEIGYSFVCVCHCEGPLFLAYTRWSKPCWFSRLSDKTGCTLSKQNGSAWLPGGSVKLSFGDSPAVLLVLHVRCPTPLAATCMCINTSHNLFLSMLPLFTFTCQLPLQKRARHLARFILLHQQLNSRCGRACGMFVTVTSCSLSWVVWLMR